MVKSVNGSCAARSCGLRGGMQDNRNVTTETAEELVDRLLVADIDTFMLVPGDGFLQEVSIPSGAGLVAKKGFSHVVVDANHIKAFLGKQAHGCRAN